MAMEIAVENILDFLRQLTMTQDAVLAVLLRKQKLLAHPNGKELEAIVVEEESALASLQAVLERRETVLAIGLQHGIRADSIQELCEKAFPAHAECQHLVLAARQRSRELRYLAMANWSMSQRSIIHLNQILEIIETKGQGRTTYGPKNVPHAKDNSTTSGGGFVDRVA